MVVRRVGVRPMLAASLGVTDASERITDLSLIQALAQPTLPGPLFKTVVGSMLELNYNLENPKVKNQVQTYLR